MKIALIGYGKMGKIIGALAEKEGIEVVVKIDAEADWEKNENNLRAVDAAIEFSTPTAAIANIRRCFNLNIPVVCGTTGWEDQLTAIKNECILNNNALFVAPNFSPGVNVFFLLNRYLAEIMNKMEQYDLSVEEIHHIHKLDTPSGTAKALAGDLTKLIDRKKNWVNHATSVIRELPVISHRTGEVPGTHIIRYFSEVDEIEIKHTAKNRTGFAQGALLAARWIVEKRGFFTMDNLMDDLFSEKSK
jgi:4-hydroxy-tetrahydrodipicolinate reductase